MGCCNAWHFKGVVASVVACSIAWSELSHDDDLHMPLAPLGLVRSCGVLPLKAFYFTFLMIICALATADCLGDPKP